MSEVQDADTALRVVVTPSQSSYFAGEPLSVTITITNTRSPQAQVAPPRSTHKRSAHSVSSARLARPPTSPGLPKSPFTAPLRPTPPKDSTLTRKGLIGKAPLQNGVCSEDSSQKHLTARSLSVDIPPHEIANAFNDDTNKALLNATHRAGGRSPRIPSPLARTSTAPVPPNHPHARKASFADGPVPIPQSASTSSFALSLDPIAESMTSPIPPTPTFPSPAPTPSPFVSPNGVGPSKPTSHAYPPRPGAQHPSQASLGNGRPATSGSGSLKPLPKDNSELVLYAYVHLTGGSMDIGIASPSMGRGHERRASIAGSLWGLLSSPVQSPGHRARAPSQGSALGSPTTQSFAGAGARVASRGQGSVGLGLGGVGMGAIQEGDEWDPEQPVPVFEVPPAMLAVDLSLGPGEERSYNYTVKLPANLPPTYKGRTLRFSYQLSVGTCRATVGTPSSQSRVMKVPIRVYNHVSVDRPPRWYDLLTGSIELGGKLEEKIEERPRKSPRSSPANSPIPSQGSIGELRAYAQRLLEPHSATVSAFPSIHTPDEQELREPEGGLTGCREAVEILTRVPKKVSYDVNKDGVKVAVLTFMKSAWRLGETVLGVVELNDRGGRGHVLKLSAMLEAHESLPSAVSAPPDARHAAHMRRVYAEHHASFMPQTLRTTFALDIPSDAAPAFQLGLGGAPPEGGLAWKVRLCLLVAVAAPGAQVRGLARDGPRGEWGSAWAPAGSLAPCERLPKPAEPPPGAQAQSPQSRSWASFFASTFLSVSEGGFHDGDEASEDEDAGAALPEGDVDIGGGEDGWRELTVETVECEVPVTVWPGNTAFRPEDVVFDV
ncbi:Rgp1-domain-containing protein [Gloeopeniophorella convolvens]|nr:Rgp1-domain-containing protein [Gloeopeniophorella convolvens]